MRWIRRDFMMPDRPREPITRPLLLIKFGVSDPAALFPCEPVLKPVTDPIPRQAAQHVLARMRAGAQTVTLVGTGGCGKTTALAEIEADLPGGSAMIIFDCYGAGRYLDSDAQRHRPQDAFLQLSNDLARRLRTPLLISRSAVRDWPRTFKRRLEQAAAIIAARDPEALLVVAVDAADNAVTAAEANPVAGPCFIPDFVGLGQLPANVRLLLTARRGRLTALNLPPRFECIEIGGFTPEETAMYARRHWTEAPTAWVEDLHALSGGNPRVQAYALEQAGENVARALDFLRPTGKGLEQVFREGFGQALVKIGRTEHLKAFCAGLTGLPRPAPVAHLAAATELSEPQVRDLVTDLRPGLRLEDDAVSFADEDVEAFVRDAAGDALPHMQTRIADRLHALRSVDPYAAAHVTGALLAAGRRAEVVALIKTEKEPTAITDPVLRRAVQLQRLRMAMKVCREAGNTADAALMIIAGAEAVRTDAALREMLIASPDLAVRFAAETASRLILRDPDEIEHHGPFLMHRMAVDARAEEWVAVREGHRRLAAWYRQRRDESEVDQWGVEHTWPISLADHAAAAEAFARIEGTENLMRRLRSWSSQRDLLHLTIAVCGRLVDLGECETLASWFKAAPPPRLFQFVPLTYLALASPNQDIDVNQLVVSLERCWRVGLINFQDLDRGFRGGDKLSDLADLFLTGCEVAISRADVAARISPLLAGLRPSSVRKRGSVSHGDQFALALRAHALCEVVAGGRDIGRSFFVADDTVSGNGSAVESRWRRKQSEDAEILVRAFAPTFEERARILAGDMAQSRLSRPRLSDEYRLDSLVRSYNLPRMRARAAVSIARLCHLPGADMKALADQVLEIGNSEKTYPIVAETLHLRALAVRPEWHDLLLIEVASRAEEIRRLRTSADDKSGALVQLVRVLAPISESDALAVFEAAVAAAGEIDHSLVFGLSLFGPLVRRGLSTMSGHERRDLATRLAVVASDAAQRLSGTDAFPWDEVLEALTQLDLGIALAAIARWEDSDLVPRRVTIPPALRAGLTMGVLAPEVAVSLLALLEHAEEDLLVALAGAAMSHPIEKRKKLAEELARDECLYFGRGERPSVLAALQQLVGGNASEGWIAEVAELTRFHEANRAEPNAELAPPRQESAKREEKPDPLSAFNWSTTRYITPEAVNDSLTRLLASRRESGAHFSAGDVLDRIAAAVRPADRRAHLEAVAECAAEDVSDWEIGTAIARRVADWKDQPAIRAWRNERLLDLISKRLPAFSYGLAQRYAPLPELLATTDADAARVVDAIVSGIEANVDLLAAPTLYALVGVIAEHAVPKAIAELAGGFAERLEAAIPVEGREALNLQDNPARPAGAIARFLYALMSDIEVPVRWRAAHSVRRLARLGETAVIDDLVHLLDRREEKTFRDPDAPFYWLSARLWLLIAFDRIVDEAPSVVAPHARMLLAVAMDQALPHMLMRDFAASAVRKLAATGTITLTAEEEAALAGVNLPALPPRPSPQRYDRGFGHVDYDLVKDRRFVFDTMDTIPYWYAHASRIFAEMTPEAFLDAAETFIVNRWGAGDTERAWNKQARLARMSNRDLSTLHRQGSRPQLERYDTHLEWHAMFCAVGALLSNHSPVQPSGQEDDYDTVGGWLRREGLSSPHGWLADHLAPKPPDPALWHMPTDPEVWLGEITEEELRAVAGLDSEGDLVVAGNWRVSSHRLDWRASAMSAMVSPDTATALLRALQSAEDPHSYRIPDENDDLTIDAPPYRLVGWLRDRDGDLGLDDHDPLRNERRGIVYAPGRTATTALGLTRRTITGRPTWYRSDGVYAFAYEGWGDLSGDQDERRLPYGDRARSEGYRLWAATSALQELLDAMNLDLLIEVEITKRRNDDDGARRHDPESSLTRTRLYVLRRDGSIEASEGRVGAWTSSRP